MSIKGFPSQNKSSGVLVGFTEKQSQTTSEFVTVQSTSSKKNTLDATPSGLFRVGAIKTAAAGSTDLRRVLKNVGHGALAGDVVRLETTSANPGFETAVLSVPDANTIILAAPLNVDMVPTVDQFYILRHVSQQLDIDGNVISTQTPARFLLNGVSTQVSEDTVTPANSKPFPVIALNANGTTANLSLEATQQLVKISLASLDTKLPSQGQALAAASTPVVLTAAQVATLTPLSTVTANIGTTNGIALDASLTTINTSVNTLLKPASTLAAVTQITNTVTVKADTLVNQVNAFKVDGSATTQPVSAASLPLPAGAATSANQTTANTSLSSIDTKIPAQGQALAGASLPVVLTAAQLSTLTPLTAVTANAGTNLNTSLLALDSTVAKDASLTTLNTSVNTLLKPASTLAAVTSITNTVTIKADTLINQTNALKVDGSATTQPVSGTFFQATQPISAAALPLPTGAATSALQSTQDTSINSLLKPASTLAAVTTVTTVGAVTAITNALPAGTNLLGSVKLNGKSSANAPARNDYSTTNVTAASFVQLVASTTSAASEIEIFDSSGQTLALAFGAVASEVIQINIFPGGNGRIPLTIPAGTRVSIKAVSASATVGEININFYG